MNRRRINTYKLRSEIAHLEHRIETEDDKRKKESLIEQKKRIENIDLREISNYGY